MVTNLNIDSYKLISEVIKYDKDTLMKISTIIIEDNSGGFYFIEDDSEKIGDVIKMPSYIKEDWVKYNKKELNLKVINFHIKYYNSYIESYVNGTNISVSNRLEDIFNKLKEIRRDFILKGII